MRRAGLLLGTLLILMTAANAAANPKLGDSDAPSAKLGDTAAPLAIKTWVKGEPVQLEKGKIYVVEFWATWCSPCRASIPHLTDLQAKLKDKNVVVIGVTYKDNRQDLADVEKFVKKMGDRMAYTIAFDEGRWTTQAYMTAFGKRGIPQAFVIDGQGKIVWEGHPAFALAEVVEAVAGGTSDIGALEAVAKQVNAGYEALTEATSQYLTKARQTDDLSVLAEYKPVILKEGKKYPDSLNGTAWLILAGDGVRARDKAFALELAKMAVDGSKGADASILDTYALALFENGQAQEAVAQEKKALALLDPDDDMRKGMEDALKQYEKAAKK